MISKLGEFSCNRISKSSVGGDGGGGQQGISLNSMLKTRLGAVPLIEVNTPCPLDMSKS